MKEIVHFNAMRFEGRELNGRKISALSGYTLYDQQNNYLEGTLVSTHNETWIEGYLTENNFDFIEISPVYFENLHTSYHLIEDDGIFEGKIYSLENNKKIGILRIDSLDFIGETNENDFRKFMRKRVLGDLEKGKIEKDFLKKYHPESN